jgi:hypothetical protein
MGLLDKLKGVANLVTGDAAKVSIEWRPAMGFPGERVDVTITATSTGAEVKSGGAFVDLVGAESARVPGDTAGGPGPKGDALRRTLERQFQIAKAFVLAAGETKVFEGAFEIPKEAQPTYAGVAARHDWQIRGRIEAVGNDPDSGFLPFRIGLKT